MLQSNILTPIAGEDYILIVMNAISVPTMRHNLIPPFIMREAGLEVNEVPKIHREDPDIDDHSIMFKETGLRIPLGLWGTFSYFPTTKPTAADLEDPEEVYVLTPLRWNPHSDAYTFNEESMLDWEGNMRLPKDRSTWLVLMRLKTDPVMVSSLLIGTAEQEATTCFEPHDRMPSTLYDALCDQAVLGTFHSQYWGDSWQ